MTIGNLRLLTIAAFIAAILPIAALSSPILGLDTFLAHQYRRDPQASNDSFLYIPSSAKSSLSFFSHLPSLVPSLLSLSLSVSVHVRLVGPSFPSGSAALLNSFISASEPSNHFHVISPFPDQSHRLSLKHNLHLDVSHAPSLASALSDALTAEIAKTTTSLRSSLLSVPHTVIDDIIKRDFEKEKPVEGIFIYFFDLGSQAKPYAYSYAPGDPSPGFTKCLGSVWTGKDRYLWIDLAAGPVDYGPSISGDGVLPQGEFHPFAALHGRPKSQKALLADLASLVWSAYQVQIVPPLRIPVPFENSLIVQLIHVYTGEQEDLVGLDWKKIERTFMDEVNDGALLLSDQSLMFKTYSVNLKECAICSFAISKSINSYTSRYLFENYTLIVSEYLDSKRLHQILSDSAQELRGAIGFPEEEFGRVLPVYVFDLDYYHTVLFLDRYHQTVSFKDMVIAVRTKNTQYVSDYNCNSRPVFTQTRELERPLVGSILQSMWGVAPTHLSWSPTHNDTIVDYSWSIGNTPFGPFSEISTLSFVQKDAAQRNVLLTSLNYSITSILDVLESVSAHGGDRKLLKRNQQAEFIQRLNLFKYKLEKAIYAMSHFDFELGLYYLRSSDHDLYGIHSLVYHASKELEASLVCFKDPPFPWATVSVYAACVVAFLYIYKRREMLFRNKRKQF